MPIRTQDQKRAKFAWEYIERLQLTPEQREKFSTACKQTASRLMNSGLPATIAFNAAKGEDHHLRVNTALSRHLGATDDHGVFQQALIGANATAMTLRRHTEEAMALLVWLSRIADGRN
jgi:CRISPR type III-B/RAMP module-associated protein Cmr5